MAGRAPTKRMRGDSHAESPAPRCRAVPARTHLRSRLTPCPPPTGPPAARFCSQTLAWFFFFSRRREAPSPLVWSTSLEGQREEDERRQQRRGRRGPGAFGSGAGAYSEHATALGSCLRGRGGGRSGKRTDVAQACTGQKGPAPEWAAGLGGSPRGDKCVRIIVFFIQSGTAQPWSATPDGRRSPSLPQSCCAGLGDCSDLRCRPAAARSAQQLLVLRWQDVTEVETGQSAKNRCARTLATRLMAGLSVRSRSLPMRVVRPRTARPASRSNVHQAASPHVDTRSRAAAATKQARLWLAMLTRLPMGCAFAYTLASARLACVCLRVRCLATRDSLSRWPPRPSWFGAFMTVRNTALRLCASCVETRGPALLPREACCFWCADFSVHVGRSLCCPSQHHC